MAATKLEKVERRIRKLTAELASAWDGWPCTQDDFIWLSSKVDDLRVALDVRDELMEG